MSSIISDIFYNSKNHALLNQYLLHNNTQERSSSFSEAPSRIIDNYLTKNSQFGMGSHYLNSPKPLSSLLHFGLSFDLPGISKNEGEEFVITISLGEQSISQLVRQRKQSLKCELTIEALSELINKQKALSIELTDKISNKKNHQKKHICYIPVENIRKMIENGESYKRFNLCLNSSIQSSNKSFRYKLICDLTIIKNAPYSHQLKDQSDFSNIFTREAERIKQNQLYNVPKNSAHSSHKKQASSERNRLMPRYIYKGEKVIGEKFQIQQSQSNTYNHQQPSANMNQSLSGYQTVLKHQFEKKTLNLVITQFIEKDKIRLEFQFNKAKQKQKQDKVKTSFNFQILGPQHDNYFLLLGQKFSVSSSQFSKQGLNFAVYNHQKTKIGGFNINIVILLGGFREGSFPVTDEITGECVGVVEVQATDKDMPQQKQDENQKGEIVQRNLDLTIAQEEQKNYCGYILTFQKVYLMKIQQFQNNQVEEEEQQFSEIVVRYKQTIIKKKCCKLNRENQIAELKIFEPIIIYQIDNLCSDQIQVEIYINMKLAGYGKLKLRSQMLNGAENQCEFGLTNENLTTKNYICHSVIRYMTFTIKIDFLPFRSFQKSLLFITKNVVKLINAINLNSKQASQKQMVKIINQMDHSLLYIESIKICRLITSSFESSGLESSRIFINHSELVQKQKRRKFIEELNFLDSHIHGYVKYLDLEPLTKYYGISREVLVYSKKGKFEKVQGDERQILYLLLLAGVVFEKMKDDTKLICSSQAESIIQKQQIDIKKVIINDKPKISSPKLKLSSVQCENMQNLMDKNSIPSILIHFSSLNYKTKPFHRCANPTISIHKEIQEGEQLIFLHYDIKTGKQNEIGRIKVNKGKNKYNLKEKAAVKLLLAE